MTWQFLADGSSIPAGLMLTWLMQSTVLLVMGLVAGGLLRKRGPAVQSALYRTTLGAVILCPVASASMAAFGFSGLLIRLPAPSDDATDTLARTPVGRELQTSSAGAEATSQWARAVSVQTGQTSSAPMTPETSPQSAGEARAASPMAASAPSAVPANLWNGWADLIGWGSVLVLTMWLVGAAALGVYLLSGHRQMARLRSSAIDAEPAVVVLCRDLARLLRVVPPSVLRSPFLCSPCLDGVRRPAILLPEQSEDHLRETFIHELAHLRRRDGLWNLLRHGATAVFWMQPLLWLLSRRLEETAEEVCDDFVVEFGADRSRYAGHLLELAERRLPPLAPAGVGMISLRSLLARRITRILDSTRALSTRAGSPAIVVTLLAGLAGTLLTGTLGVGGGTVPVLGDEPGADKSKKAAESPSKVSDRSASSARKTVHGRVVDPDGKPAAGATVLVVRYRPAGVGRDSADGDRQELDRAVTDSNGRFTLKFDNSDRAMAQGRESPDQWRDTLIVASAQGFGPAWTQAHEGETELTDDKPLRLVRDDVPITGRIVDLEGRPVAGASVAVVRVWQARTADDVDQWLKSVGGPAASSDGTKPRSDGFPAYEELPGNEPAVSAAVATDADGHFRLTGLGRGRMATLAISGPTIAFKRVQVVTLGMKRVQGRTPGVRGVDDLAHYGADCTIVAEPGRPIEGTVRDAETKAPIAGATVTAMQMAGSLLDISGLIATKTDAAGRYRLVGLPKASGHKLSVYPQLDQPYFITEFLEAPAGPGLGTIAFDIPLKRGIMISGRVTDARTGQPVQAAVHYYPFLANERARGYRNFDANIYSLAWTGSRYRTDAQGNFRIVGLPGRGIVAAKTFDRSYVLGVGADTIPEWGRQRSGGEEGLPTYNRIRPSQFQSIAAIDLPVGTEEFRRELTVKSSASLTVQLVDPEGKPITRVEAWGRFPAPIDTGGLNLHDQSRTQIVGLDPKLPRVVVFQHRQRKLGAVLTVTAGDAAREPERTVTLRPSATVTGRVVDADGKPARGGVEIRLSRNDGDRGHEVTLFPVPLGADGRFRIETVIAGATYALRARDRLALGLSASGKMEPEQFKPFELVRHLTAESGQVIELGTFNAATGQRIKEPDKPAATRKVPITGRIVDLEGRPIRGVTVQVATWRGSISKARGGDLTPWIEAARRGEPPSVAYQLLEEDKEKPSGKAETDAQGRFRIEGLGAEKVVELLIEGPTVAHTQLKVVTRRVEPFPARGFVNAYGPGTQTIYGADFTLTAAPGRVVEGIVRDARDKKVMKDVEVRSFSFAGSNFGGIKSLKTRTDAEGRFRLAGFPKGHGNKLLIVPNDDQPYFMQDVAVPDAPGIGAVPVEVGLHRGTWIEGKITDKETGAPVAGAWLHYLPFLENPFAQATPEFRGGVYEPGSGYQDRYQSKADGTYRLVGLPGRAIVGAVVYSGKPYRRGAGSESIKGMNEHGHFATSNNPVTANRYFPTSMKEINPAEGTETVHLDLTLDPGAKVRLRVVDQQGKPVPGVKTGGRRDRGQYDPDAQAQAEFDVGTLGPGEDRLVSLVHEGRKLGRVIHVKEGDDKNGPMTVTLEPSATFTGRVVDADGNPVSGATIQPIPKPGGDFFLRLPEAASGKDGRFTVPDVPTGCDYSLVAESGAMMSQRRVAFKDTAVRPGETTDVGDIKLKD